MGAITALLTRFVPSLIPGLGALLNPWVLLALLSGAVSCFLFGVYLEHGRFEAYEATQESAQKTYDFWAQQRNAGGNRINKEIVNELQGRNKKLAANNAVLLDSLSKLAQRSILPPIATSTGGSTDGSISCFDRAGLGKRIDAVLQRFAGRLGDSFSGIAGSRSIVQACLDWDTKQRQLEVDTPTP